MKPKKISDKKIASRNNSQKLSQNLITDEDIENIGLDIKLKMYKEEIVDNNNNNGNKSRKPTQEECTVDASSAENNVRNEQCAGESASIVSGNKTQSIQHSIANEQQINMSPSSNTSATSPHTNASNINSRPQFRVPPLPFFANRK